MNSTKKILLGLVASIVCSLVRVEAAKVWIKNVEDYKILVKLVGRKGGTGKIVDLPDSCKRELAPGELAPVYLDFSAINDLYTDIELQASKPKGQKNEGAGTQDDQEQEGEGHLNGEPLEATTSWFSRFKISARRMGAAAVDSMVEGARDFGRSAARVAQRAAKGFQYSSIIDMDMVMEKNPALLDSVLGHQHDVVIVIGEQKQALGMTWLEKKAYVYVKPSCSRDDIAAILGHRATEIQIARVEHDCWMRDSVELDSVFRDYNLLMQPDFCPASRWLIDVVRIFEQGSVFIEKTDELLGRCEFLLAERERLMALCGLSSFDDPSGQRLALFPGAPFEDLGLRFERRKTQVLGKLERLFRVYLDHYVVPTTQKYIEDNIAYVNELVKEVEDALESEYALKAGRKASELFAKVESALNFNGGKFAQIEQEIARYSFVKLVPFENEQIKQAIAPQNPGRLLVLVRQAREKLQIAQKKLLAILHS